MNVLEKQFNSKVDQNSPIVADVERVVNYDEDGNELVSYEPVDYPALVKSHGCARDWSLNSLLKAGINPNMTIHTGFGTRLQGYSDLTAAIADANSISVEPKE